MFYAFFYAVQEFFLFVMYYIIFYLVIIPKTRTSGL